MDPWGTPHVVVAVVIIIKVEYSQQFLEETKKNIRQQRGLKPSVYLRWRTPTRFISWSFTWSLHVVHCSWGGLIATLIGHRLSGMTGVCVSRPTYFRPRRDSPANCSPSRTVWSPSSPCGTSATGRLPSFSAIQFSDPVLFMKSWLYLGRVKVVIGQSALPGNGGRSYGETWTGQVKVGRWRGGGAALGRINNWVNNN